MADFSVTNANEASNTLSAAELLKPYSRFVFANAMLTASSVGVVFIGSISAMHGAVTHHGA